MNKSRRRFTRDVGLCATALSGFSLLRTTACPTPSNVVKDQGRIVVAQDTNVLSNGSVARIVLKKMLDGAIPTYTNTSDAAAGWKALFSPKDIVGLKLNCLGGRGLSPNSEIVDLIVKALIEAGLPETNIIVWDRFDLDLTRAGFTLNKQGKGHRVTGTDRFYDSRPTLMGSIGSCYSRFLSEVCTAIINLGVLKDHDLAGVSVAMKNWYGTIHNPHKYHSNNCDPYIADLSASKMIRMKHRLTIIDALHAQYKGGPAYAPAFRWETDMIIVGTDEVAIDTFGAHIIDEKRKKENEPTLKKSGKYPPWLKAAHERGLGENDLSKIKVIRV